MNAGRAVAGIIGGASAMGFIAGPLVGWMYSGRPMFPTFSRACCWRDCSSTIVWLSPTLRNAGIVEPDPDILEESAETPVANA